mgnify:CR=1 FL=1
MKAFDEFVQEHFWGKGTKAEKTYPTVTEEELEQVDLKPSNN